MSSGITERAKYPNVRENCHARGGERRGWLISTCVRVRRSLYYPRENEELLLQCYLGGKQRRL